MCRARAKKLSKVKLDCGGVVWWRPCLLHLSIIGCKLVIFILGAGGKLDCKVEEYTLNASF